MVFAKEADFEQALIDLLSTKGWEKEVLKDYTEADFIRNWANILYENNNTSFRLNDCPLTDGEMRQILDQIESLKTPLMLNAFINGGTVSIIRDNPADADHFGKPVALKIFDAREIAAGQTRYQIAQQPKFATKSKIMNDRRGDLMLLINGMPLFHIELKNSGIPVMQAANQIEKYAWEGVYSGIFSLVQVFVAMTPEETLYFANPGPDGKFNPSYYFHWADFNNEPINDWRSIGSSLISIPMAHQMIGSYTVADAGDGVLKVMRSYQYYAANAISDKVAQTKWEKDNQLGGYIWHTTGSGKTMTSFKTAQLISTSNHADKVVFLMDRIELGTQSLQEYRDFAGAGLTEEQKQNAVQGTENTAVLVSKLKSSNPADALIVTSIQKMSNVCEENIKTTHDGMKEVGLKTADLEEIRRKRLVFIVDECHRSTFGDMLATIKATFPRAIFFGFTGTPIQDENSKKMSTTTTVFGSELHRYSIADGIRDRNVLGFDQYKVVTFKDEDVRKKVALTILNASTPEEAVKDPEKSSVFYTFMHDIPMAGYEDELTGKWIRGIEDYLLNSQYRSDEHQSAVVQDIVDNWTILSHNSKFHAIFATSSIPEAIEYYRLFKKIAPHLKVTALFDPNIDNAGSEITVNKEPKSEEEKIKEESDKKEKIKKAKFKEEGLVEIIQDYNARYDMSYTADSFASMKKDISARLAHKGLYSRVEYDPKSAIDLLIVVDQMLTGFDSKWINTLYLDKVLEYENIIQAFSRTNRLFGPDKPFGTIKYYRRPHTMERNVQKAVELYSGNKPLDLFVPKLPENLETLNGLFAQIRDVFESDGVANFEKTPSDPDARKQFVKLFNEFNKFLEAAKIQGFVWKTLEYKSKDPKSGKIRKIAVAFDETTYLVLVKRYKELAGSGSSKGIDPDVPFALEGYITTIQTDRIDADYMNSRFEKYLKLLRADGTVAEDLRKAEDELHKTFATLSQEEQKYANIFLHDIQSGDVRVEPGKTFKEYVAEYIANAQNDQIHRFATALGLDEALLRRMMRTHITEENLNDFNRYENLRKSVDMKRAKAFFEVREGRALTTPNLKPLIDAFLRKFILEGGFDLERAD